VCERGRGLDRVVGAAAIALARDVPGCGELADNAVGGTFGDPHPVPDLAQANPRVMRDAEQHSAEHYVQHVYAKVGVSRRTGLALFAHENDLVSTSGTSDAGTPPGG
jgi:hypothetical protein